mgnify:FL=1
MESVPEKNFHARPIYVTIWRKETENWVTREISMNRRFKDRNGCWQATGMLRMNDIPKAVMLLQEAYRHIALNPDVDEVFDVRDVAKTGLIELM